MVLPPVAGFLLALLVADFAGRTGLLLALPAGVAAWAVTRRQLGRQRPPAPEPRAVAFILDLIGCSLLAGAPPEHAIAAVSATAAQYGTAELRRAVEPLRVVGRMLALGSDPMRAWELLESVEGLGPVAAAGRRCADSGARLAGALTAAAVELRVREQDAAVARAERIGVWALLPLGCCFLPAFVCIGVVPVIAGVAGQVLGS
jgi:pilus assembly protein TadC